MSRKTFYLVLGLVLLVSACGPANRDGGKNPAINGNVWLDKNENGLKEAGETGLPNVTINLMSGTGFLLEEQITDGNGSYKFKDLNKESAYTVQVIAPPGYAFTRKDAGSDDKKDSDVFESGAAMGKSDDIPNLVRVDAVVDAGLTGGPSAEIEDEAQVVVYGFVWLDANGNGLYEAGDEEVMSGVEVQLITDVDAVLPEDLVKTDSDGNFAFPPRAASGIYRVYFENPSDLAFTKKDQGADDKLDSDVDDAGPNVGYTDAFDLAQGEPQDLAAGMVFAMFTPEVTDQDVTADFTAVGPLCFDDMLSSLSLPFHVKFEAPDVIILTSPADGSKASGNIGPAGQFHLVDVDGYGTWDGHLYPDLTGKATNDYLENGCTMKYEVELTLRPN